MIKPNFHIVTGGPGGGKTSLLENLAARGYPYIRETARQIIRHRLENGLPPRPAPEVFASEIFEADLRNFIENSSRFTPLFFDRSFLDSACMIFESDPVGFEAIRDTLLTHRYNLVVFITPPWEEIYCNDTERDQSFEDATRVFEKLHRWYEQHKYEVILLPRDSIDHRAEFVLSKLLL